jgi:hypothetical protein
MGKKRAPVPATLKHVRAPRENRKCLGDVAEHFKHQPSACSIVMSGPGNPDPKRCPRCGRERIIVRVAFNPRA